MGLLGLLCCAYVCTWDFKLHQIFAQPCTQTQCKKLSFIAITQPHTLHFPFHSPRFCFYMYCMFLSLYVCIYVVYLCRLRVHGQCCFCCCMCIYMLFICSDCRSMVSAGHTDIHGPQLALYATLCTLSPNVYIFYQSPSIECY